MTSNNSTCLRRAANRFCWSIAQRRLVCNIVAIQGAAPHRSAPAHLQHAYFGLADLRQADFADAGLQQANFDDAYLPQADFVGADLQEANFRGAGHLRRPARSIPADRGRCKWADSGADRRCKWADLEAARQCSERRPSDLPDYLTKARKSQSDNSPTE